MYAGRPSPKSFRGGGRFRCCCFAAAGARQCYHDDRCEGLLSSPSSTLRSQSVVSTLTACLRMRNPPTIRSHALSHFIFFHFAALLFFRWMNIQYYSIVMYVQLHGCLFCPYHNLYTHIKKYTHTNYNNITELDRSKIIFPVNIFYCKSHQNNIIYYIHNTQVCMMQCNLFTRFTIIIIYVIRFSKHCVHLNTYLFYVLRPFE